MNALVGQEAKSTFSLFLIVASERADDGRCENEDEFTGARAGGHFRGRCKFGVFHDGSGELKPPE